MEENLSTQVGIQVDGKSPLFNTDGMFYKEFPADYRQIRYFTLLLVKKAPPEIKEINLLEQQISELIKNAVKHGNKCDQSKIVKVWYEFDFDRARVIVEDQGEGFQNLEQWNKFNRERLECLRNRNFEKLVDYVSFRTPSSDDNDGGNAMFAALEYWNRGVCFNEKKNAVAVKKEFPKRRIGKELT